MKHNLSDWTASGAAIVPQVATGTVTSAAIDTKGFHGGGQAYYLCNKGDMAAGATIAWSVQECATSDGSYVAISGASVAAAGVDNAVSRIEVDLAGPRLRYQQLVATYGGTGNAPISANYLLHGPENMSLATGAANVVRVASAS